MQKQAVRRACDKTLVTLMVILLMLGLVTLFSATYYPKTVAGDPLSAVKKQLIGVGIGAALCVVLSNVPYKAYRSWRVMLALLSAAFRGIPNITVDLSNGLLADYAVGRGIGTLVKGARNATDFDYELSLSLINRSLEPELDTIILPTRAEYQHISSTMVREMIRYGKDYSRVVPCGTAELIAEYVNKNR